MSAPDAYAGGFQTLPADARCFALRAGVKEPATPHAHHDAISIATFTPIANYGWALDGQFLLVDFDANDPERERWEAKLPPTWSQRTRKGIHHVYRVPAGFAGRNRKIVATSEGRQRIIGDIKVHGYLVGPGSEVAGHVYTVLDGRDPAPAPAWLLQQVREQSDGFQMDGVEQTRDRIEFGRNDDELASIAGFLRRRGFSQEAMTTMLHGIISSGILEQDETRPYTIADARRLARSAVNWEAGQDAQATLLVRPSEWIRGDEINLVQAPQQWWLRQFIPKGQLVLVYGDGGVGKSSWLSWVCAQVTRAGGVFVHAGIEEPYRLFLARAVLLGADRTKVYSLPGASAWLFPRDAQRLHDDIVLAKPDFIFFDSIYTHFQLGEGTNAAERARKSLGPLAEIAQATGTTIMGNFHESKAGDWLGSTEMLNVPRAVLHATREEGRPLRIAVRKTNAIMPPHHLEFDAVEMTWTDPLTGETQQEIQDDGSLAPMQLMLPKTMSKVLRASVRLDEINEERAEQRKAKEQQARDLANTGKNQIEIAEILGVTVRSVQRYLG